jgi:preprotein translocase subunit YajC
MMNNIFFTINQAQGGNQQLIFFVIVFAVFWFFMIRPQIKKQKEERKFREAIAKGDKIITSGGIHGKVSEISETKVKIDISEGVKIWVEKTALTPNGASKEKSK